MQVDFDDNHKIAAYWLTYEENQDPDKMRKIDEDLLQNGKKGYLIGITASPSPQPLTLPELAMAMESLNKRMDIWKYDQERRKKAEKEQQRKKSMSTSYYIFTEVKVNGEWLAVNGKMTRLTPNAHTVISPTFHTDARQHFEKAYLQLKDDGHSFGVADISEELKSAITEWIDPEDSVRIAVDYDSILKLLNTAGKEHCAFALRSEVASFENNETEDIWEYVSAKEFRQMDDELKKAYRYYEWNDRSGAYRYYDEIQKKVANQLQDWKEINPRVEIEDTRILLFVY